MTAGPAPGVPVAGRYARRLWSVRHAATLARVYALFERVLAKADPLFSRIGYQRLERPMAFVESRVKGALFDCRMCGQCALSDTGLSCLMNCPKSLRNGPCGGVRADGRCEVLPDMPCVWVQAYEGAARLPGREAIPVLPAVDHRRLGTSSWLRRARDLGGAK